MKQIIVGWLCGPRIYRFKGWLFEYPAYDTPWPIRKDCTPYKRAGREFWKVISQFETLNEIERETFCEGGGCVPLGGSNPTEQGTGGIE